jgi:hypothetical protein
MLLLGEEVIGEDGESSKDYPNKKCVIIEHTL